MDTKLKNVISNLKESYKDYFTPYVSKIAKENYPYKVLISTLLSLRTRDNVTEKATLALFKLASNPKEMAKLKIKEIENAIYPAGFYKRKANTIKEVSQLLINQYKGKVPNTMDELLKIKGVGRKTANLVLTEGFNKPGLCVDTHVHRISNRLGLIKTKTPFETEMALRKLLPQKYWKNFNTWLVAHGQNTCSPISPKCSICKLLKYCDQVNVKKHR